jgi:hypothetical protein
MLIDLILAITWYSELRKGLYVELILMLLSSSSE